MHQMLKAIKDQGIPIDSLIGAAQFVGINGLGQLSDSEYIKRIKDITGVALDGIDDPTLLRITFSYLINETIIQSNRTDQLDPKAILTTAVTKAGVMKDSNEYDYIFKSHETHAEGKPKKGEKGRMARKVYDEQIKGKDLTRKEAINILVKEIGTTESGASTHYANLKNEDK